MECRDFRKYCGADPQRRDEALAAHEAQCAACARYAREARSLDALIREALHIQVPAAPPFERRERRARRTWLAVAASFALVAGIGAALLHFTAPSSEHALQRAVVSHLADEAEAVAAMRSTVGAETVRSVLGRFGARVVDDIGPVLDARICIVGGKEVVHLVVEGTSGPVTVMLLPGRALAKPLRIDAAVGAGAGTLTGRILSTAPGSVAVVGHGQTLDPADERRLAAAIQWEA